MQLARYGLRRHGLARPGRADKQEAAVWCLAVFAEPVTASLLAQDISKARHQAIVQHNVLELILRLAHLEQTFKTAARMREWDGHGCAARLPRASLLDFSS